MGLETKSLSTLTYGFTSTVASARERPDAALVLNVANGYWLPLLAARGVPTLVNVDGMEWKREKWNKLAKAVFLGGAKLTARWADALVYDSRALGDQWAKMFLREGTFIPYGASGVPQMQPPLDLPSSGYILYVARFVPENTVVEFLQAAENLSNDYQVVIVGSSGYGGEIEELARSLSERKERVTWLGHLSNDDLLFALWKNAGVYYHGHSVGGTNPALVQAMALGSPTVARDTAYNREVLAETGIYADPTADDIESKIRSLMQKPDLRREKSRSAEDRARAEYTWNRICADYESALIEIIGT
ncbi:hypothetical protein A3Q40_03114 [Rhodococcus sp. PBTS 1]|nr:hypothetical protein A3Q40_03114 [Rhodococcus sp. PBTS 1]